MVHKIIYRCLSIIRLNPTALSIKIEEKNIFDFTKMSIQDELEFILNVTLTQTQAQLPILF